MFGKSLNDEEYQEFLPSSLDNKQNTVANLKHSEPLKVKYLHQKQKYILLIKNYLTKVLPLHFNFIY